MHLSIDEEMNIHAISITTTEVSDSEGMDAVLPADLDPLIDSALVPRAAVPAVPLLRGLPLTEITRQLIERGNRTSLQRHADLHDYRSN